MKDLVFNTLTINFNILDAHMNIWMIGNKNGCLIITLHLHGSFTKNQAIGLKILAISSNSWCDPSTKTFPLH